MLLKAEIYGVRKKRGGSAGVDNEKCLNANEKRFIGIYFRNTRRISLEVP